MSLGGSISNCVADPDSLNPDPDPDPAFQVNPDSYTFRIQGFDTQKLKNTAKKILWRSLSASKENIQHFQKGNLLTFRL
jgi:hypothetical protein